MLHWHILCCLWDGEREQYSFYSGPPSCYCRIHFDQKEDEGICAKRAIISPQLSQTKLRWYLVSGTGYWFRGILFVSLSGT